MATIDKQVVDMQFNNKQFEDGVSQTMSTLDKLKEKLNFGKSAESLKNLESAGQKFDMSAMQSAIETISTRFSTMGIMGMQVLQNIADSAYNTGKRMVSALTIDPIKTGFQEYETQMNAVQTILANTASKGSTLKDVNGALGELNTYADKTIYNFTEMTRNIGTFTAAGVDLDTSVSAIKGIANLAAVSGSNSQQASTAMYQLSQALSSGTVKLQDWNSVVNAGMGGQVFQDALKETARVHGVNIDQMITNEGSFRETLSEGWLTSSILTETLNKFTGDLTQEQLKSMGYTQQQADEILKMGVMANDAATKVKTFTQLIDTMKEASQSGWTQSWEIIVGDFEEAKALLTDISNEAGAWIGKSADSRNKMLKDWKELGGRTKLIENLWTGWYGIAEIINTIGRAWADVFPPTTGAQLKGITDSIGILTNAIFDLTENYGDQIYRTFKGFFSLLDIGRMVIVEVARVIGSMITAILPVGGGFLNTTASIGDTITAFRDFIKESGFLTAIGDTLVGVFGNIGGALKTVGDVIKTTLDKIFKPKLDASSAEVGGKITDAYINPLQKVKDFLTNIKDFIVSTFDIISPIVGKITDVIFKFTSGVTNAFIGMDGGLNFSAISTIINGVLVGGVLQALKKFVEGLSEVTESAGGFIGNITGLFDDVRGSLEAYQSNLKADSLRKIAIAVALLAGSLFVLSTIKAGDMAVGLAGMAGILAGLVVTMAALEKVNTASTMDTAKMTITMIAIAGAIAVLAVSLKILSTIDAEAMGVAIVGIVTLLTSIVGVIAVLGKMQGTMVKGIGGLVTLAGALVIMAGAVKILGSMDAAQLIGGVTSITFLLAALAGFVKIAGNSKGMVSVGIGMTAVATALNILSGAVAKIGGLPLNELVKGMLGVAGVLTATVVAMRLMPKDMVSKGAGMVIMASSIVILAGAIEKFGKLSKNQLLKGFAALTASLVLLVGAMHLMRGGLAGAAALVVMTAAIGLLVPILTALGSMSVGEIIKSLVTLGGALTILGLAGIVLTPAVPTLLGLGAAIALLGGGVVLAATGITLLAGAITMLSGALVASGTGISVFVASIISLLPSIATGLAQGLINFIQVLTGNVTAIFELVKAIVVGALDVLIQALPKFIQTGVAIITSLLAGIRQVLPDVLNTAFYLITQFLTTVRNNIGPIVTIASDIVVRFLNTLSNNLPRIINAAFNFIISFVNGLSTAIRNNSTRIANAAYNLISALVSAIARSIITFGSRLTSDARKIGGNIVTGIKNGITAGVTSVVNAAKNLASSALNGVKRFLGIRSPSREMLKVGKWTGEGFANGVTAMGSTVIDAAMGMAQGAYNGMSGIRNDVGSIFEDLGVSAPVIAPVLDLSDVKDGMNDVNSMMSDTNGLNVSTTASLAAKASSQMNSSTNESKSDQSTNEGSVTFIQNNTSPKALSDYDIWRQTQQLIKTVKEK